MECFRIIVKNIRLFLELYYNFKDKISVYKVEFKN